MSIPIQKVRFANEISKPRTAAAPVPSQQKPVAPISPLLRDVSYRQMGVERYYADFRHLPKAQQERVSKVYNSIHKAPGFGGDKLVLNLYSTGDELANSKAFLDLMYTRHPFQGDLSKQATIFAPQTTDYIPDNECLYGLVGGSIRNLDMMLCGKMSLVLVKVIREIMRRNKGDKELPQHLAQKELCAFKKDAPGTKKWIEPAEAQYPAQREKAMLGQEEYANKLARPFFDTFHFYIDEAHRNIVNPPPTGNQQPSAAQQAQMAAVTAQIPGVTWDNFVEAMRDYSISPNLVVFQYMMDIAKRALMNPKSLAKQRTAEGAETENTVLDAGPPYVSLREKIMAHEEDPSLQEMWKARTQSFMGRRGPIANGRRQKEVAFIDASTITGALETKTTNVWASALREFLDSLDTYGKEVIRKTDPNPTDIHADEYFRRIVLLSSGKIQSMEVSEEGGGGTPVRTNFNTIEYLEMPPADITEIRDDRLPYFLREQLGSNKMRFAHKIKRDDHRQAAEKIVKELEALRQQGKKNPGLVGEPGAGSQLRTQMSDLCTQLSTHMDYAAQEIRALKRAILTSDLVSFVGVTPQGKKVKSPVYDRSRPIWEMLDRGMLFVDPWARNENGERVDENESPIAAPQSMSIEFAEDDLNQMLITLDAAKGGTSTTIKAKRSPGGEPSAERPITGQWKGSGIDAAFSENGTGSMTLNGKKYLASWVGTGFNYRVSAGAEHPPAFNEFFKGFITRISNLSTGTIGAGRISTMVGQAMADATVKDSSGNPSPQKMMFDENDLPVAYDATKINEDDVADYNICDMAEVMETLSKRYTETLFSSIVGSNKDALAQFEVWPRSKIDKGYVPQLKGLQKAIDNYRYARDIDEKTTRFDPMKATRDDVEDMKKKVMVLLRQIGEANNPLGLTRPVFDGIKESGLLKEQLETWIARKKNHCFLLYGPAGTGKTTFAGYLAQVLHYNVMQWSMSAAVNKWVGDTRKFITAAFGILGKLRNFVILIDEVDFVLTPQQGVTDTTKDLREAFMQHFNDFAAEAGRNGCIIVSTTNNLGLLDERTQQRLTGAEHKGGTTPIKIDFPRDRESLGKLVEYWAKDSNMTLLPDVGTFCKEWTDALFKVQNAATPKNLSIRNMSVMFMAWGRTLADRSNNVIEYIEQKVKSGQMPQEKAAEYYTITPDGERISGPATDLLAHGPSALVYLVENASVHKVKQSEQNPEGEEVDSAVLEKANEAERLLHEVDKSRVPEKGMPPPKSPKEEPVVKPFGPKAPGAPPPAGAIMPPREMSPALSPAAPPPKDQPAGSPPSIAFNRKCVRRKNG